MERRLVNQLCTRTRTHYHRLQALELEPLLLVLKVRSVVPGRTSWDVSAELETREKGKNKIKIKKELETRKEIWVMVCPPHLWF